MPVANDDNGITYGPKKFGPKDFLIYTGVVILGILLIWLDLTDIPHLLNRQVLCLSGVSMIFVGIVCGVQRILREKRNIPHLTIYSSGLSYVMRPGLVYEARWDSVGTFEVVSDYYGRLRRLSVEAPITGENFSDNLRKNNRFIIYFATPLDVEPSILVDELNRVRSIALGCSN